MSTYQPQLPPIQMASYRQTARKRWQAEQQKRRARQANAWQLAHQAAVLLKEQFGVSRVAAFGSLVYPGHFTLWSDVDLAAWGLTAVNWLRASAAVRALSDEVELNLVDTNCCSLELLDTIQREGVDL
ncbi:MAG: nucleotidyltransferase domain-containing protein [Chloroflexota bacterium]